MNIYTKEDPSVRWAKLFTKLYYYMGREMIERLGEEEGKKAVTESIRKFGEERVRSMKAEAAERGLDPDTFETYNLVREMPGIGWEKTGDDVTYCPMNAIWQDYGDEGRELGKIYCEIDHILLNAFGVELERNKVLSHGDDCCEVIYHTK